ncbi:MAG: TonB-dependent receptor [Bacteroidales bacterium]|nr:TonB-dependent receptor [Bacteroidales bacterium]
MKNNLFIVALFMFLFNSQISAQMQSDSILESVLDLTIEELMNTKVSIATKSEKKISEAPGIISVIGAEEIKNLGARSLIDLLKVIPGFEFSEARSGITRVGIRGYKDKRATAKLLVLVDGIPFNNLIYGSAIWLRNQFDINSIDRIEIIRGPGSALYGRNAFSGVVNIITKTGDINKGLHVNAALGNFNTKSAGITYGIKKEKFNSFISVRKINSDNTNSEFDDGFGGKTLCNYSVDNLYINANAQYGKFAFTGMFANVKSGIIVGPFITDGSEFKEKEGIYSIKHNYKINEKISIRSKIFGRNMDYIEDLVIFIPSQNPFFPNGMYVKPSLKEYNFGGEIETSINLFKGNNLLIGIQPELYGLYNAKIKASYDIYTGIPLMYVENGDTLYYDYDNMPEELRGWIDNDGHNYNNFAFYFQDMYYPVDNLGITIGGRFDNDSEFGTIFNPRIGIVWQCLDKLYIKLLYGQAYRAPNVGEQFQLTGFATGNKDLDPETIETTELSIDYRSGKISSRFTVFNNKIEDLMYAEERVGGIGGAYYNRGKNISKGFEIENTLMLKKSIYFAMNYSYNKSEDIYKNITSSHVDISPHKLNLGFNIAFMKYFNFNSTLMYRSKMEKFKTTDENGNEVDFTKDKIGNFFLINSSLRIGNIYKNLEITTSVYNLLNQKYYYQDGAFEYQPAQQGRQIIFGASYIF